MCGEKYHAPTDCYTIKKWLTKCEDDSETANYITANTKDVSIDHRYPKPTKQSRNEFVISSVNPERIANRIILILFYSFF